MATETEIINIQINFDNALKEAEKAKIRVSELKTELGKVKETNGELSKEFIETNANLKEAQKQYSDLEKSIQKHNAVVKEEGMSIEKARNAVQALTVERNKLDITTTEGAKRLKELNKEIDRNNEFIKDNVDQYTKQKINIGNYKDSIKGAITEMKGMEGVTEKLGKAQKAFNFILKLNPIGLIVLLFEELLNAFSKTEKGTQAITVAMGVLNGIFTLFSKVVSQAIDFIVSAFETATKAINKFMSFVGLDKSFESLKGMVSDTFGDISKTIEDSINLEKMRKQLDLTINKIDKTISKLTNQMELAKQAAEDDTQGFEKMKQQSKIAEDLQNKIFDEQKKIAVEKKKLADAELNNIIANGDQASQVYKDALRNQLDSEIELEKIENDKTLALRENQAKRRLIERDDFEKKLDAQIESFNNEKNLQQKIVDNEKLTIPERQKAAEEQQRLFVETLESETKLFEKYTGKKLDIENIANIKNAAAQTEAIKAYSDQEIVQTRLIEIIKERAAVNLEVADNDLKIKQKQADNAVKLLEQELKQFNINNKSKLESANELNLQIYNEEVTRATTSAKLENDVLKQKLKNGTITQEEFNNLSTDVENKRLALIGALNKTYTDAALQKKQIEYENQLALAEGNVFAELDLQQQKLDLQYKAEIDAAKRVGADTTLIEKKYAKAELEIEKLKTKEKLVLASGFADNIASIFGEATAVGKAAAIASTTIKTYEGATAAYASLAGVPYVGPVLGAAAAAAAIASGLANVQKILSVKSGLPGETGSGGGSISGGGSQSVAPPNISNVQASVGQGIVTRNFDQTQGQNQSAQLANAVNGITLQPVLVTDDVTVKQQKNTDRNKVIAI